MRRDPQCSGTRGTRSIGSGAWARSMDGSRRTVDVARRPGDESSDPVSSYAERTVKRIACAVVVLFVGGCGTRPAPPPAREATLVERSRLSMGSELRLTAAGGDEPAVVAAFDAVFQEFDRLESLMSVWRTDSD